MLATTEGAPQNWIPPNEGTSRANVFNAKSTVVPGYKCRVFDEVHPADIIGCTRVFDITCGAGYCTGGQVMQLSRSGWFLCTAWRADGRRLATGREDGLVQVFDTKAQGAEELQLRHNARVCSVAWSPDGRRLATGCADRTARIFNVSTASQGIQEYKLPHGAAVRCVAWHPSGLQLATACNDKLVRIFDVATGTQVLQLPHPDCVWQVAWSPDGSRLATACADRTARVFDSSTGERGLMLRHTDGVRCVAWSPDGNKLATGCNDKFARVFNANNGQELRKLRHGDGVCWVAYKPDDGTLLATGCADKLARIFDVESGAELERLRHESHVSCVAWRTEPTIQDTLLEVFEEIPFADAEASTLMAEETAEDLAAAANPLEIAITNMFNLYDLDKSGFVKLDEKCAMDKATSEKLGVTWDEDASMAEFRAADANRDGKVSLSEFIVSLKKTAIDPFLDSGSSVMDCVDLLSQVCAQMSAA